MGVKLNFLNVILVLLFLLGIIISAFMLYNLPDSLLKETTVIDIKDIPALLPVLNNINLIVGATLLVGFLSIVSLLFAKERRTEESILTEIRLRQEKDKEEDEASKEAANIGFNTKDYEALFSGKQTEDIPTSLLTLLCKQLEASQAALYFTKKTKDQRVLELKGSYAYILADSETISYEFGEGLVGQAAKTGKVAHIKDVPEGYIEIFSGLGHSKPGELLIIPIKNDKEVVAVAEIATFKPFTKNDVKLAGKVFDLYNSYLSKSKSVKAGEKEAKI